MSLEQELNNIRYLRKQSIELNERATATLEKAKQSIRAGETTGNSLKDFVILYHGGSEEQEQKYQHLDAKLNKGMPVLVVKQKEELICHSMTPRDFFPPNSVGIRTTYELGVVIEKLHFGKEILAIPTQKHALLSTLAYRPTWEVKTGFIFLEWYELQYLGKKPITARKKSLNNLGELQQSIQIHSGEELKEYWKNNRDFSVSYDFVLRLLGEHNATS